MDRFHDNVLARLPKAEPPPGVDANVIAAIRAEARRSGMRKFSMRALMAAAFAAVLLSVVNFRFGAGRNEVDSSAIAEEDGDIMLDIIGLASSADLYDVSDVDAADGYVLGLL